MKLKPSATQIVTPSNGGSVIKTFAIASDIAAFAAATLAMPFELVMHKGIGKRYMNTVLVALSFAVQIAIGILLTGMFSRANQAGDVTIGGSWGFMSLAPPFTAMLAAACIGFLCHYVSNLRRFGTPLQGHSFDFGISQFLYLPFWKLAAKLQLPAPAESDPGLNQRQLLAMPVRAIRYFARLVQNHGRTLAAGNAPYGPLAWLFSSVIEPALLVIVGVALFFAVPGAQSFAAYLGIVGAALFVKAAIYAAEWKERAYDDFDARLEAETLTAWRNGQSVIDFAQTFTMPLYSAIVPPVPQTIVRSNSAADPNQFLLFGGGEAPDKIGIED